MIRVIDLCFDNQNTKVQKNFAFLLDAKVSSFLVKSQIGENTQKLVKLLSTTAFNAGMNGKRIKNNNSQAKCGDSG